MSSSRHMFFGELNQFFSLSFGFERFYFLREEEGAS